VARWKGGAWGNCIEEMKGWLDGRGRGGAGRWIYKVEG